MGCQTSKSPPARPSPRPNCSQSVVEERTLSNFDTRSRYSFRPLEQDFIVVHGDKLGQGLSGVVTKVRNRCTGHEAAVKVLLKKGLSKHKLDNLRAEVNNYLKIDHPHIARLLHVYEDNNRVCLVMELCTGKELFDRLVVKRQFSEKATQLVAYQMLLAIAYLHKHNIVHCDLKLENFLYESNSENSKLKLIDFGFSKTWECGAMTARQGTPSYTAPEVFLGNYTEKCDLWSLGVVLFLLLGGHPPFPMNSDEAAQKKIMAGDYAFKEDKWKHVSEQGQNFIRRLLVVNVDERMSADQCLNHPWLAHLDEERRSETPFTSSSPATNELLGDLRRYRRNSHFKRAAFTMMAHHLCGEDLEQIREIFLALDTDRSGTITRENFQDALRGVDLNMTEAEKWNLFDCVDVARDGELHYSEFIAATMQSRVRINQDLVKECFDLFDVSRTGFITREDLVRVLGESGFEEADASTLISEVRGCTQRRGIDFSSFHQLLVGYDVDAPREEKDKAAICGLRLRPPSFNSSLNTLCQLAKRHGKEKCEELTSNESSKSTRASSKTSSEAEEEERNLSTRM